MNCLSQSLLFIKQRFTKSLKLSYECQVDCSRWKNGILRKLPESTRASFYIVEKFLLKTKGFVFFCENM